MGYGGYSLMQHQRISLLELQLSQLALHNQRMLDDILKVDRKINSLQVAIHNLVMLVASDRTCTNTMACYLCADIGRA
jgi:hypothetical protein